MPKEFLQSLVVLAVMITRPFQPAAAKPLDIDDILSTVSIDKVDPSPDGKDLAVTIQRPVSNGEVFGRTAYEIDPSRADVWLVARDGSAKRNLTQGRAQAAGFWCAQWSPDGKRLAMLSTKPESGEPRGGSSVRLYVWERNGSGLKRLSDRAMMTQTRYGVSMNTLDLRGGRGDRQRPKVCRRNDENSPFLWLDARRVLAVQMPQGQNSALYTQGGRPAERVSEAARALRLGRVPTVDVSDSDRTALFAETSRYTADIVVLDVVSGERRLLGQVPALPFMGMLSLVVSPDGGKVAVLATAAIISPHRIGRAFTMEAQVEKRLGLVPVDGKAPIRWITPSTDARYPLDLLDWSPDGSLLALRARRASDETAARVFTVDGTTGDFTLVAASLMGDIVDAGTSPHQHGAVWQVGNGLLVRGRRDGQQTVPESWWTIDSGQTLRPASPPARLGAVEGLPRGAQMLTRDGYGAVWQEASQQGLVLRSRRSKETTAQELLRLDTHLAAVDWGETRLIDYQSRSGKAVKGLLILPPGYRKDVRYPLLVWVYPGNSEGSLANYWSDPHLPGVYNLQLYAARGYAVLVPSMPLARKPGPNAIYEEMDEGVTAAVDNVVSLGIADPLRVGLFGQSFGGYAVYALVTQTDRFAAAVAMSGFPDLTNNFGAFDPGAVGWPGIAQDKGKAAFVLQNGNGFYTSPFADPAFYAANSPLTYVAKVRTPLLMAHASLDTFAGSEQAEAFFTQLDQQGKPARLLRYDGENHSLAASPANVRHLYGEIVAWFDRYLKAPK